MTPVRWSFSKTLRLGAAAFIALAFSGTDQRSVAQTAAQTMAAQTPAAWSPASGADLSASGASSSSPPADADLASAPSRAEEFGQRVVGPQQSPAPDSRQVSGEDPRVAPAYHRYIEPHETAQHLTRTQTAIFGLHQSLSPYFLVTILAASGYEQARNSAPNYGTNIGSYGERLGAAAIRNTSQSVFSDSLMAPLLHQDPRFYVMGNRHNVFERSAYAASRVLVTRSADDGRAMPNYSQVAGYAEAAALTNAYYPDVNVGFGQTARSLGGSLLGLAVSNVVREFLPDILRATRLQRFE